MPAGEPEHLSELALTSDEARQLKWQVARPSRCWVRAADSRRLLGCIASAQPPCQDVPVKAAGLLIRLILELLPQRLAQQMELRQRALAAARERVDTHQLAVRALVQGLVNERLVKCRECRGGVACLLVQAGEIDEQGEVALAQRLPSRRRPLVEAILGEQLAGVQVDRLPISLDARRARGLRRSRLELLDVDSEPVTGEGEDIVNERDPRRAVLSTRVQSATRDEHHLAQVVRRRRRIPIGPQRLDHVLAMQRVSGREREQLDDTARLPQPPSRLIHHLPIRGDAKAAEKVDPELRSQSS